MLSEQKLEDRLLQVIDQMLELEDKLRWLNDEREAIVTALAERSAKHAKTTT